MFLNNVNCIAHPALDTHKLIPPAKRNRNLAHQFLSGFL